MAARFAFGWLVFVLPSVVWADDGSSPTNPDGFGDIIAPPASMIPSDGQSLFEAVSLDRYSIFTDLGTSDLVEKSASVIYEPLQVLSMLLVRLAIALSWWLERLTDVNGLSSNVGSFVETSASTFNGWLLPTALAVGAGLAYAQARRGESGASQLLTVTTIGVLAVGLSLSGTSIVKGLDSGRALLSTTVGNGFGASLTTTQEPVAWPTNFEGGTPTVQLARKSGDTVWRTFAVTPWCETQFGSLAACKRYGATWLTKATDDDRRDYIENQIKPIEGDDGPTVLYLQGHSPSLRIVSSMFSLVLAAAAGLTIGGLAFAALTAWIIALLLLCLAGFFLAIMVIPGRPRAIGLDYIASVIAGVLLSALVGGILWATLALSAGAAATATTLGYLPMIVLSLVVLIAGWKSKSILESILNSGSSMRGGHGDRAMRTAGTLATRKLTRPAGGLGGLGGAALGGLRRATGLGGGGNGKSGLGGGGFGGPGPGGGGGASRFSFAGRSRPGSARFASLRPQGRPASAPDTRPTASIPGRSGRGAATARRRPLDGPRYNLTRPSPRRIGAPSPRGTAPGKTPKGNGSTAGTGPTGATHRPAEREPTSSSPSARRAKFVELRPQPDRPGRPAGRFATGSSAATQPVPSPRRTPRASTPSTDQTRGGSS